MLKLDFAIMNLIEEKSSGVIRQKAILDRLTPYLLTPRIETLIDFSDIGSKGCKITMPIHEDHWQNLAVEAKIKLMEKLKILIDEFELKTLSIDRSLKNYFTQEDSMAQSFLFGDFFIKALAQVSIEKKISEYPLKKLIIIGDVVNFEGFLESISKYQLAMSLQNLKPIKYEKLCYKMLYEKGIALSNSFLSPYNWQKSDLVIILQDGYEKYFLHLNPKYLIKLNNQSRGHAKELESELEGRGINSTLGNLAPMIESSILAGENILNIRDEKSVEDYIKKTHTEEITNNIQKIGQELGLWEIFLDKD